MLSIFANCFLTRSDQHHPNLLIILCKFIDECVQLRLVLRFHPSSPFIHTIIIIIITANWSYLILRATNDSQEFFDHFGPPAVISHSKVQETFQHDHQAKNGVFLVKHTALGSL